MVGTVVGISLAVGMALIVGMTEAVGVVVVDVVGMTDTVGAVIDDDPLCIVSTVGSGSSLAQASARRPKQSNEGEGRKVIERNIVERDGFG
jgi:hypothetical protein